MEGYEELIKPKEKIDISDVTIDLCGPLSTVFAKALAVVKDKDAEEVSTESISELNAMVENKDALHSKKLYVTNSAQVTEDNLDEVQDELKSLSVGVESFSIILEKEIPFNKTTNKFVEFAINNNYPVYTSMESFYDDVVGGTYG